MRKPIDWLAGRWRAIIRFFFDLEGRKLALRAGVTALFGIWLIWLNPFDLFHKADEASSNAFQFFVTPFIDHRLNDPPITVVLFTPSGLESIRRAREIDGDDDAWTWPLKFDQQAQILDRIVHYKPAAVFYDIEFYQSRGPAAKFRKSLEGATQPAKGNDKAWDCERDSAVKGIPVFLAHPPYPQDIWPPLCNAGTQAADVVWSGRPNVYPLLHKHEIFDGGKKRTLESLSPAAAVFAAACARKKIVATSNCFDVLTERKPVNLVWRSDYDPDVTLKYSAAMLGECDYGPQYAWQRGWLSLSAYFHSFYADQASSMAESVVGPCPFAAVIGADTLVLHQSSGQTDALLRAAFKDRVVFIGADMPGLRDRIASPFHGMVPGVFAHAAAFDNLVESGEGYVKALDEEDFLSWNRAGQFIVVAIGLFLTLRATEYLRERVPRLATIVYEQPNGPTRRDYLVALMSIVVIVVVAFLIAFTLILISEAFFFWLRQAPLDWIGELTIIWIAAFEESVFVLGMALLVFLLYLRFVRDIARNFLKDPKEASHA